MLLPWKIFKNYMAGDACDETRQKLLSTLTAFSNCTFNNAISLCLSN